MRNPGLWLVEISKTDQIQLDFGIIMFARPQIQWGCIDLVDEWRSKTNTSEIDTFNVMLACVACFDPDVIELR